MTDAMLEQSSGHLTNDPPTIPPQETKVETLQQRLGCTRDSNIIDIQEKEICGFQWIPKARALKMNRFRYFLFWLLSGKL